MSVINNVIKSYYILKKNILSMFYLFELISSY